MSWPVVLLVCAGLLAYWVLRRRQAEARGRAAVAASIAEARAEWDRQENLRLLCEQAAAQIPEQRRGER